MVTGGTNGIGLPCSEMLLTSGHQLVALHRHDDAAAEAVLAESGAVVEHAPVAPPPDRPAAPLPGPVPVPLSARGDRPLRELAGQLRDRLAADPGLDVGDVGHALATAGARFEHRAVVLAADRDAAQAGLDAVAAGRAAPPLVVTGTAGRTGGTVLVFPGQGSQWAGMGLDLMAASPTFRDRMTECALALDPYLDWSLLEVLRGEPGAPGYDRDDVVQPVSFAMFVSLAALWERIGVRPDAVIGHSQGEIAAACVAGALSLPDAARVVALRSQTISALAGTGGMVSVRLPADRVAQLLGRWSDALAVAVVNGPSSTVVSGAAPALRELLESCRADGIRARVVPVDYASHTAGVEPIRDRLLELLAPITPRESQVPFFSAVTGDVLDTRGLDAGYWYRSLRHPVRFEAATRALVAAGHTVFVEASPHAVLTTAIEETLAEAAEEPSGTVVIGSLRRDGGGLDRFLVSAAKGWVRGLDVDWSVLTADRANRPVELPT